MAFPALELVGIYQIGQRIGLAGTLLWLFGAVLAGVAVIRATQMDLLPRLVQAVAREGAPVSVLWAGGRRLIAGVLLILPGAISDMMALVLLAWPGPKSPPPPPPARGGAGEVIEGEFRREE